MEKFYAKHFLSIRFSESSQHRTQRQRIKRNSGLETQPFVSAAVWETITVILRFVFFFLAKTHVTFVLLCFRFSRQGFTVQHSLCISDPPASIPCVDILSCLIYVLLCIVGDGTPALYKHSFSVLYLFYFPRQGVSV